MAEEDIYYSKNLNPIVIVTKWEPNPTGGRAFIRKEIMLTYGQGIDVSILGLTKEKPPKEKPPKNLIHSGMLS